MGHVAPLCKEGAVGETGQGKSWGRLQAERLKSEKMRGRGGKVLAGNILDKLKTEKASHKI